MDEQTQAYWDRLLTNLVAAVGVDEAQVIAAETMRRMGEGGSSHEWTVTMLKVASERGWPTARIAAVLSLAEPRCLCGGDWLPPGGGVRYDIVCPKHDHPGQAVMR
jgi:hypothetical protein